MTIPRCRARELLYCILVAGKFTSSRTLTIAPFEVRLRTPYGVNSDSKQMLPLSDSIKQLSPEIIP